jgi:hypothetical protein
MRWIAILALFLAACTALAQSNASRSPAAEAPWYVRSGKAKLVEHFNNPQQMLRLAFSLAHPHRAEEQQLIHELTTPGSPQFHHFLTPAEWNARFSPSVEDEQAVVDWATSQGMTITQRWPNRLLVDVEAPVATIEKALQVTINNYQLDGYTYFSNAGDAVIPAKLSGTILSVGGLDNLPRMRPAYSHGIQPPGPIYSPGPVVGKATTYRHDADRTRRQQSSANDSSPSSGYYSPSDIWGQAAYNYDGLQNLGHCCNPGNLTTGSPPEASIAIAAYGVLMSDATNTVFSDVATFASQFNLAANVTAVPMSGVCSSSCSCSSNCSDDVETTLDTEWSLAMSNSLDTASDTAHIYVYEGGRPEDVFNAMITDGYARIFTTSWGNPEIYGVSSSEMDTRDGYFSTMVALGWTLMAASGDHGATADCDNVSVSYPASDPNIVGVGGTTLELASDDSIFSSEVAWTGGTKAGSCSSNGGGSGGGCSVKYEKVYDPSLPTQPYAFFQIGDGDSCGDSSRSVPDIALNANHDQNIYAIGSWRGVGGTSIASPMLAGFFAQEGAYQVYLSSLNSTTFLGLGNGNPYLYTFGPNASYAPHYPFYDITSGNNSNDVSPPTNPVTLGCGVDYFCAGPGYDSVTGWGSANMLQLAWAINTYIAGGSAPPVVDFTGSPTTGTWYNTDQTVKWSISDASGDAANGVAGFSSAWDSLPTDSSSKATPYTGTADSFYSGPQTPNTTTGSLTLDSSHEGCHTAHVRAWDNAGATSDNTYGQVCYDDVPPVVNCGSPDGKWHASNVSIACTASDSLSGLAVPADSSFNLTTSVPAGTETSNASTSSLKVYDIAGNLSTAGPIGGNMIDRKPPTITINQPVATTYVHSGTLTLNYTVNDYGSGVASYTPTMDGNTTVAGGGLTSGTVINLLTALPLGANTFKISAADKVGNNDSSSVTFTIIVTPQSIINDVNQFVASHGVSRDVGAVLLGELEDAMRPYNAGQCRPADTMYSTFISTVQFMTRARSISPVDASILIADARYLISHCP